jgi:hypothetical protein
MQSDFDSTLGLRERTVVIAHGANHHASSGVEERADFCGRVVQPLWRRAMPRAATNYHAPMIEDLVAALDRRYDSAVRSCKASPARILPEVHYFTQFLATDPRLAAAYEDVRLDALAQIARFREADDQLAELLVSIRDRLGVIDVERSDEPDVDPREPRGLAAFDHVRATHEGLQLSFFLEDLAVDTKAAQLSGILHALLEDNKAGLGNDTYHEILRDLWNVSERINHLRRGWLVFARADHRASSLRLESMSSFALPDPPPADRTLSLPELATGMMNDYLGHPLHDLRALAFGENPRPYETKAKELAPETALIVLESAYEAIRARLGTTRSRRALVRRFALRAQLYDANELRALAAQKTRPEDALADRLARYLFDEGLNPLTQPIVGSLRPDLLDATTPWTLYVEAKQYSDARIGRQIIIKGIQQIWDTLGRLQSYPHPVREAFYVVFRRGGARIVLPEEVRAEGTSVYPMLIDIAPANETGSRQRNKAVSIAREELMPRVSQRDPNVSTEPPRRQQASPATRRSSDKVANARKKRSMSKAKARSSRRSR